MHVPGTAGVGAAVARYGICARLPHMTVAHMFKK
jgi:hypothetical protein